MCGACEAWVADAGFVEIDATGVRVTYRSGQHSYVRRMSRATFRSFVEVGIRQLNEFEARERENVVPMFAGPEHATQPQAC